MLPESRGAIVGEREAAASQGHVASRDRESEAVAAD
jgi:hypothetical protein